MLLIFAMLTDNICKCINNS